MDNFITNNCNDSDLYENYPFEGAYTGLEKNSSEKAYENQKNNFRKNLIKKSHKQEDMKLEDKVNHPAHYNKGTIETYDYIVDTLGEYESISYCQGNIIKYISRMWHKGKPLEDAEKAEWYLKAMIKLLKETKGSNWG